MNSPTQTADLILCADTIHTMEQPQLHTSDAIAISQGTIIAVDSRKNILRWADENTKIIDAGSGTITPGFTDSHIHPVAGIGMTRGVCLSACTSEDEVVSTLFDLHREYAEDEWVLGWGLNPNVFESGNINNRFLEVTGITNPILLRFADAHSALANSVVLEMTGQAKGNKKLHPHNPGWVVEMEELQPILDQVPPQTLRDRALRLIQILSDMAATGFTTGFVMDLADEDAIEVLREAELISDLPLELRISPWFLAEHDLQRLENLIRLQGEHGRRWVVEGVKLMIDGTIDNGTAWLYQPDIKGESTTSIWLDTEQYRHVVHKLHSLGIQTNTHAIGDNGVGFVINVLSELEPTGVQHRIEHIETLTDEDLNKMATFGISASMQPEHCTYFIQADGLDNWCVRLGPERAHQEGFRLADIYAKGIPLALGSDWPVSNSDARKIFAAAVLRRPAGERSGPARLPGQELTPEQVLQGFTVRPHETVGLSGRTIEVGQPATLTVFENNPLLCDPDDFAETAVLLTVIDGSVAYEHASALADLKNSSLPGVKPEP